MVHNGRRLVPGEHKIVRLSRCKTTAIYHIARVDHVHQDDVTPVTVYAPGLGGWQHMIIKHTTS